MKRCKHENVRCYWWRSGAWVESVMLTDRATCDDCGAWLSLGPSADDSGRLPEIAAARLIAGWHTANDTDDTLDDPICVEVIAHMVGASNIETWLAREAFEIHEAATHEESE